MVGDVDRNFAGGLDGIGMERDTGFGSDFADGFNRLNHAGFVVGHHDADEFCVWLEGGTHFGRIDGAGRAHRQNRNFNAASFGFFSSVQDGVMLDGGGDEVVAGTQDAEDGGVIALSAAGGEDDLGGAAVQQSGNLHAGVLDGGAGALAEMVDGGGVAEGFDEERPHGLEHLGEQRRGGVGVHVDAAHIQSIVASGPRAYTRKKAARRDRPISGKIKGGE